MNINNISVFCASSTGIDPIYMQQAYRVGKEIAQRGQSVVYGGARVGLMGAVASGAIENGGKVYGVIPEFMKLKEIEFEGLTETYIVETMHQRKAKMEQLSDAIIALPGGFGTMDELFEIITWGQLALHEKPVGLLNLEGFYDPMVSWVDSMIARGFVKPEYRHLFIVDADITSLLDKMDDHKPMFNNSKWFQPATNGRV